MPIAWNNNKRKLFRQALQDVYRDYACLEIFLSEELDIDIARISGKDALDNVVFQLLKKSDENALNALFEAFKKDQPDHHMIAELEQQPLVNQTTRLSEADWSSLFHHFQDFDAPYLAIACRRAFKAVFHRDLERVRPDCPPLNEPVLVQNLLAQHDDPVLAVQFVEFALVEFQRPDQNDDRDLTVLEQWRDRIAQQHKVVLKRVESALAATCHAYLLVTLVEIGAEVNVYPELHITGENNPVPFGATPVTCPASEVAEQISKWIPLAEATLPDACDDAEVTLELFLPCKHLQDDLAMTWCVKDKREKEVLLGTYRRLLVRSAERIGDRTLQQILKKKWRQLEECVNAGDGCSQFHCQEICLEEKERGYLRAILMDTNATGLKLIAKLPNEAEKRTDLFYEIIDAAIPIAVWCSGSSEDATAIKTEFDELLKLACLTNFAALAKQWRYRRMHSVAANQIRLLCDHPHRSPNPPNSGQETDALVAS